MTDNIRLPCGSYLRTDEIDLVHHQRMKVQYGDDGSATDVSAANPLPVTGPVTDAELRATPLPTAPNNFYVEVSQGNVAGHSVVHKFGANAGVPNGTWELVTGLSAATKPFPSAATTVRVKAGGNAADTAAGAGAQAITVVGLTSALVEGSESIELAGASASASTTTQFWRIYRAYVTRAGTYATPVNTANIVLENTAGTLDLMQVGAGNGQSLHAAWAAPTGYDVYLIGVSILIDGTKAADVRMFTRENLNDVTTPFAPARVKRFWSGILGAYSDTMTSPMLLLQSPGDIWFEARGGGQVTSCSVDFDLLLVAQ